MSQFGFIQTDSLGDVHMNRSSLVRPSTWQDLREGQKVVVVELRARHPRGVIARLSPYTSYYWSNEPREDQPPFPTTLFVVERPSSN